MLPKAATPIFENNLEEATRETADLVAKVFNMLLERGEDRDRAQRFILQSIFTMFDQTVIQYLCRIKKNRQQ